MYNVITINDIYIFMVDGIQCLNRLKPQLNPMQSENFSLGVKKSCLFLVTLPRLIFCPSPKLFIAFFEEKMSKNEMVCVKSIKFTLNN